MENLSQSPRAQIILAILRIYDDSKYNVFVPKCIFIYLYIISWNKYIAFCISARVTSLSHFQLDIQQSFTQIRLSFFSGRSAE